MPPIGRALCPKDLEQKRNIVALESFASSFHDLMHEWLLLNLRRINVAQGAFECSPNCNRLGFKRHPVFRRSPALRLAASTTIW